MGRVTVARTELSNVWKTGWKIEGMTYAKPRPFSRSEDPSGGAACGRGEGPRRRPN